MRGQFTGLASASHKERRSFGRKHTVGSDEGREYLWGNEVEVPTKSSLSDGIQD